MSTSTLKAHFRMTASEQAMGRYMRAPDHPAGDEFEQAFANLTTSDKDGATGAPADGGTADGGGDAAAAAAGADSAGAAAGDGGGSDTAAAGAEGAAGGEAAAAGADGAANPAADAKGAEGAAAGADGGGAAGGADAAGADGADAGATGKAAAGEQQPDADDILNRLADAVAKAKPAAESAAVDTPAADDKPLFTEEEQGKLSKFAEDYPDEAEYFDLRARQLVKETVEFVFGSIAKEFMPVRETVQALAQRAHLSELENTVEDYDSIDPKDVKAWIDKQPAYLQKPFVDVIQSGTAEEVADLVNRYREANGIKPAGAPAGDQKPQGGDTELSSEAKKAATALAPVGSKRSQVQQPEDTSDFDGAFEKWKKELADQF